jgi:hypothetical protein
VGRVSRHVLSSTDRSAGSPTSSNHPLSEDGHDRFQGGGFTSEAVFAIPPGHPAYPLFVAIFGYGNTIDLFATTPVGLATGGRLDRLMEVILMGLSTS